MSMNYTLYDEFEFRGKWWLPHQTDVVVDGVLQHQANKIILDLSSSFHSTSDYVSDEIRRPRIIWGLSHEGESVTLYDGYMTNNIQVMRDGATLRRSVYDATHMLIGAHCGPLEGEQFEAAQVDFTQLDGWISRAPFDIKHVPDEHDEKQVSRIDISIPSPPSFRAYVPCIAASIASHCWYGLAGNMLFPAHYYITWLRIEPNAEQGYDWFNTIRDDLRNLLTLFIGDAVYPKRFTLIRGEKAWLSGESTTEPLFVQVFYSNKLLPDKHAEDYVDTLVSMRDVQNELASVMDLWFSKANDLRPIYGLFFGTLYNKNMFQEMHFISLTQCVEGYLRRVQGDRYMPQAEFRSHLKEMRKAIGAISSLPDEIKK